MPTTDPYGQSISVAALTDAPNAQMLAAGIVDAVAPRTVMRFTSASNRSATLVGAAAPVPGMITYLTAEDRYEARMADNTWQTISPGPWVPLTFASGYVAKTGSPGYRVVGDTVELRGTVEKSTPAPFTKGVAFTIATLPAAVRPSTWRYFVAATEFVSSFLYARVEVGTTGDITVIIPPGTATAASWLSLDSLRYSIG
ncbi:hypothetical protein [Streptomyces gardneri]|uniref:hypothetical protein n=1 Tax=Streptomyces gardneri TaxID=66892 RepID=UPI0035D5EDA6